MNNLFDLKGRVAVMTGACGVLGATIVKYFAAQRCKVVLLDLERAREIGERTAEEIKKDGGEAMFLPTTVIRCVMTWVASRTRATAATAVCVRSRNCAALNMQ